LDSGDDVFSKIGIRLIEDLEPSMFFVFSIGLRGAVSGSCPKGTKPQRESISETPVVAMGVRYNAKAPNLRYIVT
jgi:hypothetical protein